MVFSGLVEKKKRKNENTSAGKKRARKVRQQTGIAVRRLYSRKKRHDDDIMAVRRGQQQHTEQGTDWYIGTRTGDFAPCGIDWTDCRPLGAAVNTQDSTPATIKAREKRAPPSPLCRRHRPTRA